MATLRKRFGQRLREIRVGRGMSQERFAELLSISVDFLILIERGRNAPSFETLDRMAKTAARSDRGVIHLRTIAPAQFTVGPCSAVQVYFCDPQSP